MTKLGKCDICRARKIKCDEARPVCRACKRTNRPCSYETANTVASPFEIRGSEHIESPIRKDRLCVRKIRTSAHGGGAFLTLEFDKSPNAIPLFVSRAPSRALVSTSARLASQWARMVGSASSKNCSWEIFCSPLRSLPAKIGSDDLLDHMARYTIDSYYAYKLGSDPTHLMIAQKSSVGALKRLRVALSSESTKYDELILIVMAMLTTAEAYVSATIGKPSVHILGLSHMLRARRDCGRWGKTEALLMRGILFYEIWEALLANTNSVFDDVESTSKKEPKGCPATDQLDAALDLVLQKLTRIPRLARLVRQIHAQSGNAEALLEALALAEDASTLKQRIAVEKLIEETTYEGNLSLSKEDSSSLSFTSIKAFDLATHYHAYRVIVSAIYQQLLALILPPTSTRISRLQTEEQHSATAITQYISYAFSGELNGHWAVARVPRLLAASYGAWRRLELRRGDGDAKMMERAVSMQRLCVDTMARAMEILYLAPHLSDPTCVLDQVSQTIAGGSVDGVRAPAGC